MPKKKRGGLTSKPKGSRRRAATPSGSLPPRGPTGVEAPDDHNIREAQHPIPMEVSGPRGLDALDPPNNNNTTQGEMLCFQKNNKEIQNSLSFFQFQELPTGSALPQNEPLEVSTPPGLDAPHSPNNNNIIGEAEVRLKSLSKYTIYPFLFCAEFFFEVFAF